MRNYILIACVAVLFILTAGCDKISFDGLFQTETAALKELAWGKDHPEWDKALRESIAKATPIAGAKNACKTVDAKECLAQFISIMAKYESSYNPASFFYECSKTSCKYKVGDVYSCIKDPVRGYCMKGNPKYDGGLVKSTGLMQISISSALSYKCDVKTSKDLEDPIKNLECAVKIATKWIAQDGVFYQDDTKFGLGRYWGVMRDTSDSKSKILKYMSTI